MAKELPLCGRGGTYVALVDDEDYVWASTYRWYPLIQKKRVVYAVRFVGSSRNGTRKGYYLHREAMKAESGQRIDHKDGNGLNCQKSNLRFATGSQNNANRFDRGPVKWPYRGVAQRTNHPSFIAYIGGNGSRRATYLGNFPTIEEAARAYDRAAVEVFGAFARLNFPKEV